MKLHLLAALGVLLSATLPAAAETGRTNVSPSTQSSGAGVPGKAGGKSGPAVRHNDGRTANANDTAATGRIQDTTGIQGKPGGKSGPPASSR